MNWSWRHESWLVHGWTKGSSIVSGSQLGIICLGANTTCIFSKDSLLDFRFITWKNKVPSKTFGCLFKSKVCDFPYELNLKENLSHIFLFIPFIFEFLIVKLLYKFIIKNSNVQMFILKTIHNLRRTDAILILCFIHYS